MVDVSQLELVTKDVAKWNEWREENPAVDVDLLEADLKGVNLSKANLSYADLRNANLSGANLSEADLHRANLNHADLPNAVLNDADLYEVDLWAANLRGADLRRANLCGARLNGADLRTAKLSGADLRSASFINTNLKNADLTGCRVYGASVWDVQTNKKTMQSGLIISRYTAPKVMVDDLEVAQFIYLLLNRKKLRNVLNAMTEKGVLILGRFGGGGLAVLQAVAARIRELGYLPMLFDFESSESRDFTETVITLVGLSRFVIADLSGPSVLKELEATVPDFEVPFIPIIEKSRQPPSVTTDLTKYGWFRWPPVIFANRDRLIEMLPAEVIAPAEEIGKKRQERRAKLFPNMK